MTARQTAMYQVLMTALCERKSVFRYAKGIDNTSLR
jgi:hypothetical protein